MPAARPSYRPSGRVNLLAFFPLAGFALLVALGMGFALTKALHNGAFFVVFSPLLLGLPVAGAVFGAVRGGACRSRVVGGVLGLVAGLVYFLGYYQIDLAHRFGIRFLTRVDVLPRYIEWRVKTDVSRKVGAKDDAPAAPRPGDTADLVFRWVKFGLNGLVAVLPAVVVGVGQAARPYCERARRWLVSHPVRLPADVAEPAAAAVYSGNAEGLAAALRPAAAPPADPQGYTLLTVEYVPGEPDSPVYLTIAAVTGADRPKTTRVQWLVPRSLLTADEAAALTAGVALPGTVVPPRPGTRPGAPAARGGLSAQVVPLPAEAAGRVLTGGAKALATAAGLAPLILGLTAGGGIGTAGYALQDEYGDGGLAAGIVLGVAAVATALVYTAWYGDYLPSRVYYARSRAAVADRPDAVVGPDDPDAVYVQIVPRANWGRVMLETATEVGFLKVDARRRVILYEGDRERWVIPAESILSLAVEEFRTPPGGDESAVFAVVVLTADAGGRVWEAPLAHRHIRFGKRDFRMRRRLAAGLYETLADLLPERRGA